ncbi:MAG: prepilin peptidase [Betaproteobacteria bacterium]|nr:prepilin peptidase [Betaproteobacteria bacterium]
MSAAQEFALAWVALAGLSDLRSRRIPNWLVGAAAGGALLYLGATGRSLLGATPRETLEGCMLGLALTLPGYLPGKLGAGDVKFMSAIGLLGGWGCVLTSFVVGSLLAGLFAALWLLADWLRQAGLPQWGLGRVNFPHPTRKSRLPFGAALAAGFAASLYYPAG